MSRQPKRAKPPQKRTFYAKKEYPAVHVRWLDACRNDGYLADGDSYTPGIICNNVGILVDEDEQFYVVGESVDDTGKIRHYWEIPKSWVLEVIWLKANKKRKS